MLLGCLNLTFSITPAQIYSAEPWSFQILESDTQHLLLELSIPAFETEIVTYQGVSYQRLKVGKGWGTWGRSGQPELPQYSLPIGLPWAGEPTISILETEQETLPDYHIYPKPGLAQNGSEENLKIVELFTLDQEAYAVDAVYPGVLTAAAEPGFLRDQPLFQLKLYPFQYNPVRQELSVIRRMKVLVTFPTAAQTRPAAADVAAPKFRRLLKNVLVNYDVLGPTIPSRTPLPAPQSLTNSNINASYVIITHPNFLEAAQAFGLYRASQGESVAVVNADDLYNQYSGGVKSPEAIRDYLVDAYENWSTKPVYVLLIGDADERAALTETNEEGQVIEVVGYDPNIATDYLPSHYEMLLVFSRPAALDAWYAKLSKNQQGQFDPYPDVFVGRITARSSNDVQAVLNKVQTYEQIAAPGAWATRAILVADDDAGSFFQDDMEKIAALLPDGLNLTKMYSYDPTTTVENEISQGALLLSYSGHGFSTGWGRWVNDPETNIFRKSQVANLTNSGQLPFLTVANCVNGWFANAEKSRVMAEEFLLRPNQGAVAAWAPTNLTFPTVNTLIHEALHQAIFGENQRILGEAATTARLIALAPENSHLPLNLFEAFTYFGDPAIRLTTPDTVPKANFHSSAPDLLNQVTEFSSTSTGTNLSYEWNFGDGTVVTTDSPTISHTYLLPGSYTVTLTVENTAGTDTMSIIIEIISNIVSPTASFLSIPGQIDQVTSFINTGQDGGDLAENLSYRWDFGDDATSDSSKRTVEHIYRSGGVYTVRLTISNSEGEDTFEETVVIDKRIFLPALMK